MNRVIRPDTAVIIFQPFPQRMSRYADDGVYLGIKVFWTPQGLNGNAVLLDFAEGSVEVFFAYKTQESNQIIASA